MFNNKYYQGKIYKLVNKLDNNKILYIGSTIKSLRQRLAEHKAKSVLYPNRKIYKNILIIEWDDER